MTFLIEAKIITTITIMKMMTMKATMRGKRRIKAMAPIFTGLIFYLLGTKDYRDRIVGLK